MVAGRIASKLGVGKGLERRLDHGRIEHFLLDPLLVRFLLLKEAGLGLLLLEGLFVEGLARLSAVGLHTLDGQHPVAAGVQVLGERHAADDLDQAVLATSLRAGKPLWWPVFGTLQVIFALAAVVGLVWLVVIAAAAWLQLPAIPTFDVGPFATPFLLLVGGLLAGLLLAALARWLARIGARRRAAVVRGRLRASIGRVADERVVEPVHQVLSEHADTRADLRHVLR